MFTYYLIAIILIIVDQITKYITVQNIELGQVIEFIPNVLSFTYIRNTGAAWSILEGRMLFFYIITVIVVAMLLYLLHTEGHGEKLFSLGISFMLGGAIGNFIDRLFHKFVIDMIMLEFIQFPIFNLADTFLTIGVIIIVIYIVKSEFIDRKEA